MFSKVVKLKGLSHVTTLLELWLIFIYWIVLYLLLGVDRGNKVNAIRSAILETFPEPNRRLLQRCQ